jgi:serine/threonine protein kinase
MLLLPVEPTLIGPYRVLERIGSGGMAEVFLARRTGPDGQERDFAIKLLHQELASDPNLVSMFYDEAALASRLRHPGIVQILEHGQDESGRLFMVLEYVRGHDLRWCLAAAARARYWLPVDFALTVTRDLVAALAFAHDATDEHGRPLHVVHRDVTHSNVFLSYEGHVKLADFGIARARGREQRTRTGLVRGKVGYLSPEQVRALPLDGRSDLFGAAVVLWELLTQRRMFVGETDFKTMLAVCSGPRRPPSDLRKGLPANLDALVLTGTETDKDRRFSHGEMMIGAIESVAQQMGLRLGPDRVAAALAELEGHIGAANLPSRRPSDPTAITRETLGPPMPVTRPVASIPPPGGRPSLSTGALEFVEPWESTRTSTAIAYGLLPPEEARVHAAETPFANHPIYVRTGLKVSRITSLDALVHALDPRNASGETEVSTDAIDWMPIAEFAPLAELEFALWTPPRFTRAPASREKRTISILGGLALHGGTGIFVVDREGERYTCLLEVGGLVGLLSTRPSQQILACLAASGVVPDASMLGAVLHGIIEGRAPLHDVLSRRFNTDPELIISFRKTQAIDILEDVLDLNEADFGFLETTGWPDRGFLAGTALELVARATHRWAPAEIERALATSRVRQIEILPEYPLVARMLRLRRDATPVLRQIRPGRTLEQLLAQFPEGSESHRMAKSLAFIFSETGAIEFR